MSQFYGYLFDDKGVANIKAYKNKGVDLSYIYNYIISPSLNRIVEYFPRSLAPNVITLVGLSAVLVSTLFNCLFFPNLVAEPDYPAPRWVFLLTGLTVGFYQFMDNIDGKQARRTGSGSPLGHLFDHGCDALNTIFQCLSAACIFQWGANTNLYWLYTIVAGMFWFATWEEYYCGALILRQVNGPIEGLIGYQILCFFTYYAAPNFWVQSLTETAPEWVLGYLVKVIDVSIPTNEFLITYVCPPAAFLTMFLNFSEVLVRISKGEGEHSIAQALKGMFPYVFLASCMGYWVYFSTVDIIAIHPWTFTILYGLTFCKLVSLLIVCHLVNKPYPTFDFALWFLPVAVAVVSIHRYIPDYIPYIPGGLPNEEQLLTVMLGSVCLDYYIFVQTIITNLCKHLDVWCFHIKPKSEKKTK